MSPATESPAVTSAATGPGALRWVRLAALVLFGLWVGRYIRQTEPLLHGSLLIFHEAGHVIFMPFGEFMTVLGGSLFQLILPLFFVAYFARRGDYFAAAFAGLYFAASCADVGRYIADARAGDLPLLGGERSNHDWTFLLLEMNRLDSDIAIGRFVRNIGVSVFWASLLAGGWYGWYGSATPPTPAARVHGAGAPRA